MAKGKMKERKLAFWKDGQGFIKGFGEFTLVAGDAQIYCNSVEVRKAQKAFESLKIEGLSVIEFPEIKDHKRKAVNK